LIAGDGSMLCKTVSPEPEGKVNRARICPICENHANKFAISDTNLNFLELRYQDKTLDDAISLSAIAWHNFPALRLSSDSRTVINALMKDIREEVTKALDPLEIFVQSVFPLSNKLQGLIDELPSNVKDEFCQINEQLSDRLKSIEQVTKSSNEPIQRDLKELFQFINLLTNKPIVKGSIGEETLALSWPEAFPMDSVSKRGGPGKSDMLISPCLEINGLKMGQKIAIERKSGQQRYSGAHLHEAVNHSKIEGARFCLLIYDSPQNLLESQKPLNLTMLDGVMVGVGDVQSASWRALRQLFGIMQTMLPNVDTSQSTFDVSKLKNTVEQMHSINLQIDVLRKSNISALCSCQKVQDSINQLEKIIVYYEELLKGLLNPRCNKTPGQQQEHIVLNYQTDQAGRNSESLNP